MQTKFRVVSLSHRSAPVHIRELISLDDLAIERLLLKLKEFFSVADALVLSTCNRTEVYYSHESDLSVELIKLIGIERGLTNAIGYLDYFQVLNNEQEAVTHLFRVSMGLEAQVVGDIQISNQVKRAYQTAADLELAGPFLHRLMHTIFFTNKRVVQETAFRDGAASLSYATIELIESLTQNIFQPRILLIGVGEIGEDVARNMVHLPTAQIKISNRTLAKAEEIGFPLGFEVIPFESCLAAIEEADVVVCSIRMAEPFITKAMIESINIPSYKVLIDLSVPRSIETTVEELPGVGHKTASVVMAQAFGVPAFPVDTHIHRLIYRWGLSSGKSVEQTEVDCKKLFPIEKWNTLHLQIIFFGREFCPARGHVLEKCPVCSKYARKGV